MQQPLISYVIPCYNCESTIYDAVMSIKESDAISRKHDKLWDKIEIILVDDGSTDCTYDVLEALSSYFPNIKIKLLLENRGKGFARNTGNQMASADIIAVLDSDDWNIGDRTGEILKTFKANPDCSIFYSSFKSKHIYDGAENEFKANKINKEQLKTHGTFNICHSSIAYTKKAILENPYSEDKNKDDWDMLWNFYTKGYTFRYSDKFLVAYRISKDDIDKMKKSGLENQLLIKKQNKMKDYWNEKNN